MSRSLKLPSSGLRRLGGREGITEIVGLICNYGITLGRNSDLQTGLLEATFGKVVIKRIDELVRLIIWVHACLLNLQINTASAKLSNMHLINAPCYMLELWQIKPGHLY